MGLAAAGAAVFGLYQLAGRLRGLYFSATSLYEATLFIRDYSSFLTLEPAMDARATRPRRRAGSSGSPSRTSSFTYPESDRPALDGVSLEIGAGRGRRARRRERLRQDDAGEAARRALPAASRARSAGTASTSPTVDRRRAARRDRGHLPGLRALPAAARARTSGSAATSAIDDLDAIRAAARARRTRTTSSRTCRTATRRCSGREFAGGYDLSVGQWQRVALARAFFRDAPFVILDEPTAALDARAESRAVRADPRAARGPHGAADLAPLLERALAPTGSTSCDEGRVVEHGLPRGADGAGGLYAELFTLQAARLPRPASRHEAARMSRPLISLRVGGR